MGGLYADMVSSALSNIETTFAGITETDLERAAKAIWTSRRTYTFGVGVNSANAHNFTYLTLTGIVEFHAIPKTGSAATDDLVWVNSEDILIAMTFRPYRREVVETAKDRARAGSHRHRYLGQLRLADNHRCRPSLRGVRRNPSVLPFLGRDHCASRNTAQLRGRQRLAVNRGSGRALPPAVS